MEPEAYDNERLLQRSALSHKMGLALSRKRLSSGRDAIVIAPPPSGVKSPMVRLHSHPVPTVASSGMAEIVARHAVDEGVSRTPIPFLSLIRFDRPTDLASGMLKPSVCLVVQGGKRTFIGPRS